MKIINLNNKIESLKKSFNKKILLEKYKNKLKNFKKEQKNKIHIIYLAAISSSFLLTLPYKTITWLDFSLFVLVLINVFLFIYNFNIKTLLINLVRFLLVIIYKISEFPLLKIKDIVELNENLLIGFEEIPLDYAILHNYIRNFSLNLEFYQIILLLLPGFLYIEHNINCAISCFGGEGSQLLKTAAKYPEIKSKDLQVEPIKIAYEKNLISRSCFNKMLPLALLEQNNLLLNSSIKPSIEILNSKVLKSYYEIMQTNKNLEYIFKFRTDYNYAQNAVLNSFLKSYFNDLERASAKSMDEIVSAAFPEIKTSLQIETLMSSLEIRKLAKAGDFLASLGINQQLLYQLFLSDNPLVEQYKAIYKRGSSSMARLLYSSALNIYSGVALIDKYSIPIKSIDSYDYDVNISKSDSNKCFIEVKSGNQKTSIQNRIDQILKYYKGNEDWENKNIQKIAVMISEEITEKDLEDLKILNQDYIEKFNKEHDKNFQNLTFDLLKQKF